MKEQEKLIHSLREDSQRISNMEFKVRELNTMKIKVNSIDESVK